MKRKYRLTESIVEPKNGDHLFIRSCNYPEYAWGLVEGARTLSIVKQKNRQIHMRLSCTSLGLKSTSLSIVPSTSRLNVEVDQDSSEVTLGASKAHFVLEILESFNESSFIGRFVTKSGEYLRHSNYLLRVDSPDTNDHNLEEDSRWIVNIIQSSLDSATSTAPGTPNSVQSVEPVMHRPIFIHIEDCKSAFASASHAEDGLKLSLGVLVEYLESCQKQATYNSRASRAATPSPGSQHVISYLLQGAGGMSMDAQATAISTFPPNGEVPEDLVSRIEEATTVKSRGGVKSFLKLPEDVSSIITRLGRFAKSHMKRKRMFGMVPKSRFDLELGFCEWITLPHGSDIIPHRDGGNDCDVAAIFALYNSAHVTVEGTRVQLDPGQMYIFEPQKYTHSVSKPLFEGPRHAVALRFFRQLIR